MTDIDTTSLKAFGKAELPANYVPKVATLRDQFAMAALREIACDGEDCDCLLPQYCSYGIARLALGEKKE